MVLQTWIFLRLEKSAFTNSDLFWLENQKKDLSLQNHFSANHKIISKGTDQNADLMLFIASFEDSSFDRIKYCSWLPTQSQIHLGPYK